MVSKSVLNGGDGCSIVMDEDDVLPATLISHKHLLKEDLFVLVCNPGLCEMQIVIILIHFVLVFSLRSFSGMYVL